jgi:hypothetical protein
MNDWMGVALLLLALGGVAAVEWSVRRAALAHVRAQMMVRAGPVAPGVAAAVAPAPAAGVPHLHRCSMTRMLPGALDVAATWEAAPRATLSRALRTDLAFAALYGLAPLGAAWLSGADVALAGASAMVGVLLVAHALLRHALALHRLDALDEALEPSPDDPLWKRALQWVLIGVAGLVILLGGLVLVVLGAPLLLLFWGLRYVAAELAEALVTGIQVLLSALFVVLAGLLGLGMLSAGPGIAWKAAGVLVAAGAALHAVALVRQARALRRTPGSALLVLRVFERQKSTEFVFNHLMRSWRYFGQHFTVVDGSLVQASGSHRLGWLSRLGVLAFILFTTMLGANGLQMEDQPGRTLLGMLLGSAAGALVVGLVVRAIASWQIGRRFIRDREQLLQRLRRLQERPRNLDLSYRHERAMCHDDTWFMAVNEFARRADVVLMDLRGLAISNKGCEMEVEYLFDTVPASRIVFLVDGLTPAEAIEPLLARCWRLQHPQSPNLRTAEPELLLYEGSVVPQFAKLDRRALLLTLMQVAEAQRAVVTGTPG